MCVCTRARAHVCRCVYRYKNWTGKVIFHSVLNEVF